MQFRKFEILRGLSAPVDTQALLQNCCDAQQAVAGHFGLVTQRKQYQCCVLWMQTAVGCCALYLQSNDR